MRDCTLEYGNLHQVLLSRLDTLGDGGGDFTGLAQAPAYNTVAVTDNDDG